MMTRAIGMICTLGMLLTAGCSISGHTNPRASGSVANQEGTVLGSITVYQEMIHVELENPPDAAPFSYSLELFGGRPCDQAMAAPGSGRMLGVVPVGLIDYRADGANHIALESLSLDLLNGQTVVLRAHHPERLSGVGLACAVLRYTGPQPVYSSG